MADTTKLPESFKAEMKELLGEEYQAYLDSFREEWKPGLRANTLKISPERLRELAPWELEPVPWTKKGFYYSMEERPSKHPLYYAGLYYLQEPSAMTPAALLPVRPGDRVLDLCAAPGGKSTELAARLEGEGLLISNDISSSRARGLLKNLELAGASNIGVVSEEPKKLASVWPEFFDAILVDAPCSGEGMFRKEPQMIRDWLERGPKYYAPIQREILTHAVTMLKPGGYLLYSTCTFSRLEDEETVEYLLEQFPELEPAPLSADAVEGSCMGKGLSCCIRLFPHRLKGEGHFLALLHKKEDLNACGRAQTGESPVCVSEKSNLPEGGKKAKKRRGKEPAASEKSGGFLPEQEPELWQFLKQCRRDWDVSRFYLAANQVYYLPEGLRAGLPLRFLRTGLLLGELKNHRFEPSQALAMALKPGEYENEYALSLEDERVIRYLKGETLVQTPQEKPFKGWVLVTAGGYPLGWAKAGGASLKNKYYPGWRWT